MTQNRATQPAPQNTAQPGLQSGSVIDANQRQAVPGASVKVERDPKQSSTKPKPSRESDVANSVLNLERETRKAESEAELGYLIVNGSRVAVQYRQALLLMRSGPKKHRTVAVSSLSAIDRNSTFIRWIESLAKEKLAGENMSKVVSFDARENATKSDLDASSYPFSQIAIFPLRLRDGSVFAHVMFTRESAWDERGLASAARLCETYSHAWEALTGPKRAKRKMQSKSLYWIVGLTTVVGAGFIPLPLSVLALQRLRHPMHMLWPHRSTALSKLCWWIRTQQFLKARLFSILMILICVTG